jgi:hypothetical protein
MEWRQLPVPDPWLTSAIAADSFNRTPLHGLFTKRFLVGALRLLVDIGVTAIIITREICGRGFAAKIAIDALIIHVKLPSHVLRILICNVSHNLLYNLVSDSQMVNCPRPPKGSPI